VGESVSVKASRISVLIPDGEDPLALRVMRSLGRVGGLRIELLTSDRADRYGLSRFCHQRHFTDPDLSHAGRVGATLDIIDRRGIDVL